MSLRYQEVISTAFCALFVALVLSSNTAAQATLKKKVDSLFVIASSGEVTYRDMVQPAIDSIAAIGAEAAPILIDKFTTKSARERMTIMKILKEIGSPAVPYLVRALRHPDGLVVQRVCWSLSEIGDSTAVEPLISVTGHERWQVRDQAVSALGEIGDLRAREAVLHAFDDRIGHVRKAAAVVAGMLGITEGVGRLIHVLGDEFYGARMSAMEALLKLDTVTVIGSIADSVISENELVGDLGCYVLGQFGTDGAIEILLSQAGSADPDRRAHAVVAMINADPDDNCGYRDKLVAGETDRFVLLKIQSAVYSAQHAR